MARRGERGRCVSRGRRSGKGRLLAGSVVPRPPAPHPVAERRPRGHVGRGIVGVVAHAPAAWLSATALPHTMALRAPTAPVPSTVRPMKPELTAGSFSSTCAAILNGAR